MGIPFQERMGILSGGNWVVDRVKMVDHYPERERLADILSESIHNGGAAYNMLTDLSMLRAPFSLAGVGLVGADDDGDRILHHCRSLSIDVSEIRMQPGSKTSSTDVMTERLTGKRTFFHHRGANAHLDLHHFNLDRSRARIFHLGYLLLLDRLDHILDDGRTKAYHLLARARSLGFKTAVDVVSEESDRFAAVVSSALPAVDILFLNEYEAQKITGIPMRRGNATGLGDLRDVLKALIAKGVKEWAILHFPEGACALSAKGEWHCQGSLEIPQGAIAGTVGAGDAFAAGVLYGVHQELAMAECLVMGVCAAGACLTRPGSSEGMVAMEDCLRLGQRFGFRDSATVAHSYREK